MIVEPVLPPQPPAIVKHLTPKAVSESPPLVGQMPQLEPELDDEAKVTTPKPSKKSVNFAPGVISPPLLTQIPSAPSPPTVIPVEDAPELNQETDNSAANLGSAMSIGEDVIFPLEGAQFIPLKAEFATEQFPAQENSQQAIAATRSVYQQLISAPQTSTPEIEGTSPSVTPNVLVVPHLNAKNTPQDASRIRVTRLLTQERGGAVREFEIREAPTDTTNPPSEAEAQSPETEETEPGTVIPIETINVVEVTADRQEYDDQRRIITAQGNVEMRFAEAVLTTDRLEVNLNNRLAVASGNVALVRGEQVLRGERFEYFFVQDSGVVINASGEIYLPTAEEDFNQTLPADPSVVTIPQRTLSDRLAADQPLTRITTSEGYAFVVGSTTNVGSVPLPQSGGRVNRLRFQAERLDFNADGWQANDIRVTNDPFSPPELELRADTANFRNLEPFLDEITTTNSRIVLDQSFTVPIFQDRIILDRRPREPGLVTIGFDGEDRGGLFIERSFDIIDTPTVQFKVTPQYLVQRAIFDSGFFSADTLGLELDLEADLGPRTDLVGAASFTSLDLGDIEDTLRASVRLQHLIGDITNPHTLNLEYSFRDRLFNGSLGFRTVQSSLGAVLTSPRIFINNDPSFVFNYQAGVQYITARSEGNDFLSLVRYQGAASVSRSFLLWQGEALPPTAEEGLRYTPVPVQPFLRLNTGITGVTSFYGNGDGQQIFSAFVGLTGQLGHFSRPYLDYTGFNLTYSQAVIFGRSPFVFDRAVDSQTLSLGITQQIYGPFRFGVQSAFSLGRGEAISTDFFLEYSRRTYNVIARYNPTLRLGSFSFRVNDFNWVGSPEPFEGDSARPNRRGLRGRS